MRWRSCSLICRSFARRRLRIEMRLTANQPLLFFPQMCGRVGPGDFAPSLSQNRTGTSRFIRLPSSKHTSHPDLPMYKEIHAFSRKRLKKLARMDCVPFKALELTLAQKSRVPLENLEVSERMGIILSTGTLL